MVNRIALPIAPVVAMLLFVVPVSAQTIPPPVVIPVVPSGAKLPVSVTSCPVTIKWSALIVVSHWSATGSNRNLQYKWVASDIPDAQTTTIDSPSFPGLTHSIRMQPSKV